MKELENKVAYITGGSKGIGYGVAKKLIAVGMKVAISGRTLKTVKEAAEQLGDGQNILPLESDVTQHGDEEKAVKAILEKWGQLDVVLANAGVGHFAAVDELS
ncbi:MAG: SDR family NAD(P)-dependent oxidoreductase, partial [Pricia sp.]|nr:SDR family NAD(P)-dependent oxidoreductase [Pricia sp.]